MVRAAVSAGPPAVNGMTMVTGRDGNSCARPAFSDIPSASTAENPRALAITSPERSSLLPDLATMAEVGFPRVRTEVWYGLLASARTPASVLGKLKAAVAAAQTDPAFREGLSKFGISPASPGADSFARFIRDEVERWTPIVTSLKPN